uniref:Calponin-homology (CH) domain-containing protein n=1 Tax=Nothoprocta perdicaria TaxID=30464 RepID=A0A8C7A6Q1_NOTPE
MHLLSLQNIFLLSYISNSVQRCLSKLFSFFSDEQESVQKRTFTKWINTHLAKRNPPMLVNDLFEDIKDGVMLIALLEVLSGQKLLIPNDFSLPLCPWQGNQVIAVCDVGGK